MTARNSEAASNELPALLENDFATAQERAAQAERVFMSLMHATIPVRFDHTRALGSEGEQFRLPKS